MADRRISFILGANIKNFTKGLDKAQKRFQSFGNTMQSVGKNLTTKLTLPIVGAGAVAIKTAAQYESLRQSMDILNGSAAEGARNFERLKRFSARTPFQLQDLASAQNMLQGFGQTADDAFESLSMIGDIAAVSGGDIKGIGIAFGQAAAEGRVMTRDIRQFINQGVPMIKMLSETMGVAQSDILDLASEGKISFEILQQAFREATSEGGMFADGMAKQSRTISGLFSTLKDNVSIALGEIGDELTKTLNLKELMSDLIEQIQVGVEWFKNLSDQAKRLGIAIAGILIVVGPTILIIGKLISVIALLMNPIGLVVAAVGGMAIVIYRHWDDIKNLFSKDGPEFMKPVRRAFISIKELIESMFTRIKFITKGAFFILSKLWGAFGFNILSAVKGAFTTIGNVMGIALHALSVLLDVWSVRWLTDWDGFLEDAKDSFTEVFGKGGHLENIFSSWFSRFLQNDPVIKMGNWISDLLGLDGPIQKAATKAQQENQKIANDILGVWEGFGKMISEMDFSFNLFGEGSDTKNDIEKALDAAKKFTIEGEFITSGVNVPTPRSVSVPVSASGRSLNDMNAQMQRLRDAFMSAGSREQRSFLEGKMADLQLEIEGTTQGLNFLKDVAQSFTDSFGQGISNLIVQGGKFVDVMKNMKRLLLSAGIQKAVSTFLTGGLGGSGFLGTGGGLFGALGKIIGVNDALITSGGDVVKFHPDDNILAMKDFGGISGGGNMTATQPIIVQLDSKTVWQGQKDITYKMDR